jgi:hypothetical protein
MLDDNLDVGERDMDAPSPVLEPFDAVHRRRTAMVHRIGRDQLVEHFDASLSYCFVGPSFSERLTLRAIHLVLPGWCLPGADPRGEGKFSRACAYANRSNQGKGGKMAGGVCRPWQSRQMPVRLLPLSYRRLSAVITALGSALVVCSPDVACGGLATENQGGGSGDSASTDGEADAQVEAASNPCVISASSYDVSCSDDSDCAAVWFGNVCSLSCVGCATNGAVNVSTANAYLQDVSRAVDGRVGTCPCLPPLGPVVCCDHGACVYQSHCGG